MRVYKYLMLIPVLLFSLALFDVEVQAAEPPELLKLRATYGAQLNGVSSASEKQIVLKEYVQQLVSLENNMRSRADINEVRKEMREANEKISSGSVNAGSETVQNVSARDEEKKYQEPNELLVLREKYHTRRDALSGRQGASDLLREYIQDLTSLENNLRSNMKSRSSVNAVRSEIRKSRAELTGAPVVQVVAAPLAESKPVIVSKEPAIETAPEPVAAEISSEPEIIVEEKPLFIAAKVKEPVASEPAPEPVLLTPAPVAAFSMPDIVPVIAVAMPPPEKAEAKPVPMAVVKPVLQGEVKAPVAPVMKPVRVAEIPPEPVNLQPAPLAAAKQREPAMPELIPAGVTSEFKPAAPQAVVVPIVKSRPEVAVKPTAPESQPGVAAAQSAPTTELTQVAPVQTSPGFKPAAPQPAAAVAAVKPEEKPAAKTEIPKPLPAVAIPAAQKTPDLQTVAEPLPVVSTKPGVAAKTEQQASGRTHVNETRGIAGNRAVRKDYVYTFNLDKLGAKTTLTFYASGQSSTDTFGKIWLINLNDRPIKIGKWKAGDFSKTADMVSSFKELEPITIDITKAVAGPGKYKIEFEWTDLGKEPLVILRVEITS